MRITVLSDNKVIKNKYKAEHGLCLYVETENYKILLDTGASDAFIKNAKKLAVDLKQIDYVFISHGHNDHIGGLESFLQINQRAKVVLSRHVTDLKLFSLRNGYRTLSGDIDFSKYAHQIVYVDDRLMFENEIQVFSVSTFRYPLPSANSSLYKDNGNGAQLDNFEHELVVCLGHQNLVVYTGCAHNGLLNILNSIDLYPSLKIDYVIGGFHLLDSTAIYDYESDSQINALGNGLKSDFLSTSFITGHCTGEGVFLKLKQILGNSIHQFYVGYSLNI